MIGPGDWMVDIIDMICDTLRVKAVATNIVHFAVAGVEGVEIGH